VALLVTKLGIRKWNSNEKFGFSSYNGALQFSKCEFGKLLKWATTI
jgi:hypothetical protein